MKKNKKIKLALNKQTIATLDNDALKDVKGGKAQFLSMFNCSRSKSCRGACTPTNIFCDIVIVIGPGQP